MRRRSLLVLMVAAVMISSGATWVAAQQIQSPAEVAARTAPPEATPILVPVVQRRLTTRVVTRGTAHYGSPRRLSLTSSPLKTGPRIVTGVPREGAVLAEGEVLATVSGRPVFLLDGRLPSYRDLGPGMSGRDVRQLEVALRRLGLDPGAVDGRYDAATEAAVAAMFQRRGFAPLVAGEGDLDRTRPAEAQLVDGSWAQPGVQMAADEVVFVPDTPLRVTEIPTRVGTAPDGALVTVTDSEVVTDGFLPVEQAGLVRPGATVVLDEPTLGIAAKGRVTRVAGRPGTDGADGFHVFFEVAVSDPPAALVGASVRLTIPIRSTRTARLTVPVSAVSLGPDGGARVQRSVAGRLEMVPVRTGLSADGHVSVTPLRGSSLAAGDMVTVGLRDARRRGG